MPTGYHHFLARLPFRITFGADMIKNFTQDVLRARMPGRVPLRPLILAYFVTFRCNLSCSYCNYSANGFASRHPETDTAGARRILRLFRQGVPSVGFSGGEPLLRDDIVELTAYAKELGYAPVTMFTNSLLLPRREGILEHVDFLQISLDTLDARKQDCLNGGKEVVKRVCDNISRYAPQQKRLRFRINLNCVVGPDNLDDVEALMAFALEKNVRFSIAPQLNQDGMPVKGLIREPERTRYRCLMDRVIEHKKKTNTVLDIVPFLAHLRDVEPVHCYPEVAPRVYADGSFIYPCPNLCKKPLDALAAASWKQLLEHAERQHGRLGRCDSPCFLPCYTETSLLVRHPHSLIREMRG